MDVNLTGPIASQIAANLIQPWYSLIINSGVGAIGVMLGVWVTQRNESRKARREERKKAYFDIIDLLYEAAKVGVVDPLELGHCVAYLQLLGSKNILIKTAPLMHDILNEKDYVKRIDSLGIFTEKVIPLMRIELLLDKDEKVTDSQRDEAKQYCQKVEKK